MRRLCWALWISGGVLLIGALQATRAGRTKKAAPAVRRSNEKLVPRWDTNIHRWEEYADAVQFILAIYRSRKEVIVDVLHIVAVEEVGDADIELTLAAPKVHKDKTDPWLEWDREFRLRARNLLYNEPLGPDFGHTFERGLERYHTAVKRGLTIAKEMQKKGAA